MKIRTLVETSTKGLSKTDLLLMLAAGLPYRTFTHEEGCGVVLYISPEDGPKYSALRLTEFGLSEEFVSRYEQARELGADFLMFDRDAEA